jgi:hypothetical protein
MDIKLIAKLLVVKTQQPVEKTPLRLFRVSFKGSKNPLLQCFGVDV